MFRNSISKQIVLCRLCSGERGKCFLNCSSEMLSNMVLSVEVKLNIVFWRFFIIALFSS